MPVDLICSVCGAGFIVRPSRIKKGARYCSYLCHQRGEGRKGGAARGAQKKAESRGLAYTKTGGRHTHRVLAEQIIGRALIRGEVVHHRDGNKLNNAPENLAVLPSQAKHIREHHPAMMAARRAKRGH